MFGVLTEEQIKNIKDFSHTVDCETIEVGTLLSLHINNEKDCIDVYKWASAEDMEVATKQFLNLLLLQMKYASPAENAAQEIHPTLSKILQYIDEHLTEDLSAEALANSFFVSSSWIYQVFHNDLGIRLSGYVNNKRVLLAQRLMQSGTPPTQVYLACGFQEYSTFYRQYKKRFGCSPKLDKN